MLQNQTGLLGSAHQRPVCLLQLQWVPNGKTGTTFPSWGKENTVHVHVFSNIHVWTNIQTKQWPSRFETIVCNSYVPWLEFYA